MNRIIQIIGGLKKINIDTKILFTFTTTIFVGLIIIIGSSSAFTISFSNTASDDAGHIVLEEELINLNRLVKDKALLIDGHFDQLIAEIKYLASFAEDLINGRLPITTKTTYTGIPDQNATFEFPDNYEFSAMQNDLVSFETSGYYLPDISSVTEIDANTMALITNTSYLDFVFKSIFTANPLYIDAYIGFSTGLYVTYPYRDMSDWPNKSYTSTLTGETLTGFDPRHTNFYVDGVTVGQEAIASGDDILYAISKPYFNSEGIGLEMSLYQSVYFDNGTLIGVVGTNLTLASFEGTVKNLQILDTGYAFLLDQDLDVIVHKEMEVYQSSTLITNIEFSESEDKESEIDSFNLVLNEMGLLSIGQTSFTKNHEKWYISYHPIEKPKFSLAIVISENQILASADAISSEAYDILVRQLIIFIIVSIIFAITTIFVIRRTSNKIVEPIKELTDVTEKITQGNLRSSMNQDVGGSKEVVMLFETFRGLVTALRFGNEDYYAGNLRRAMNNYQNALQLFTTMKNDKGIGICYNNIGNIQNAQGRLKEANNSYQKAITIAQKLLDDSTTEEQRFENTLSLASRTNNVAMLYNKIDRFDEAEELLKRALELDKQIDNHKGYSTRYANLGLNYLSAGKHEEAKIAIYKSLEIANDIDSNRSIAYANMNLGIYYNKLNEKDRAKELFLSAIELAKELDIRVVITSLSNLKEIYENEGEVELAFEIDKKLKESQRYHTMPREIIFVIDYSGSMSGRRIKDAKEGIVKIFEDQIKDEDSVSIISFSYEFKVILESALKGDLSQRFYNVITSLNRPYGGTAMYDAMAAALEILEEGYDDNEGWIIVLTDGEDNSSKLDDSSSIINSASQLPEINLVIIAVGDLKKEREKLQKIANSLSNGVFIGIEAGVSNAISEAFEEVGTMLAAVDVEGFVPDY